MTRRTVDSKIVDFLTKCSPAARKKICEAEPMYFAIYYFPEYFNYEIPPFHYDFYQDIKDLGSGKLEEAAWIAYRDSAKTSVAKIAFVTWLICFKKRSYITWDSYDGGNSEQALFDITVALQSNKKIIRDFGQLYHMKEQKETMSEAKMKRINKFITENGIKVESISALKSTRGHLKAHERPDCYILDDLENAITAVSYPTTAKIKRHYDELKAGLPASACVLVLGNYITEEGTIGYIMEKVKKNPRGKLRFVPVVNENGEVSWPGKYVKTDAERTVVNAKILDLKKWRISLEARERDLGKKTYQSDMMNNPAHGMDKVFDRDTVEALLKGAKLPTSNIAGFKTWSTFNPSHRYAIGADTAKGVGIDSNASVLIDFSMMPARVVGTYKNNMMSPNIFAYELKRQADVFGQPLIAPELNNTGYATITQLKMIYPLPKIYIPLQDEKVKEIISPEYGFDTNSATKPEIIYQLKEAVERGLLQIFDEDLLNEMKYYSLKDLNTFKLVDGMTRHFDLLMACAIAWDMRIHAKVSDQGKKPFRQGTHTPLSEYGG